MALLFLDSFDHYATADITEKWTSIGASADISPIIAANGRSANCVQWTTTNINQTLRPVVLTPSHGVGDATMILGMALKVNTVTQLANSNYGGLVVIWAGSTLKCGFRLNPTGTFQFGKSGAFNTYISSGVPVQDDTWAYVEFKVVLHDTAGSAEVSVNGTTVLLETNIDTINSGDAEWTTVALLGNSQEVTGAWSPSFVIADQYVRIDDVYLLDGTTGSGRANNTFWGDTTVRYIRPNADTTTADWSPSGAGDNYADVDDTTPDDDSSYVSTSTLDATDLYDFPAVTSGAEVTGIQAVISAKKGDTGAAQIAAVLSSGATTEEHSGPLGIASDTAYNYYLFPWDGDPNAGPGEWTESSANALQIGPRKTA